MNQTLKLNYLYAMLCLMGAVYLIFAASDICSHFDRFTRRPLKLKIVYS